MAAQLAASQEGLSSVSKGVSIKVCCLNKIIQRLKKPETSSLFRANYGFYPMSLHPTARNAAIQSYTVTESFRINLYVIKRR
jgi:hypothetical protein